ncbi:MAG: SHOCT domain-containing protein [Mucilaginibacter sp.]|nr:SHOCT domain-containing protein [Mucilaginibacter sp.]
MGVDYLPKVQARKLYQYAQQRKEDEREARRQRDLEEKRAESGSFNFGERSNTQSQPVASTPTPAPTPEPQPAPVVAAPPMHEIPKQDELTEKLKKLRTLFENGLISQEEYNAKKLELLSDL